MIRGIGVPSGVGQILVVAFALPSHQGRLCIDIELVTEGGIRTVFQHMRNPEIIMVGGGEILARLSLSMET